jgi:hypothetical protein
VVYAIKKGALVDTPIRPKTRPKTIRSTTPQEQAMLIGARQYVACRAKARTKEQVKAAIVRLLRTLDAVAAGERAPGVKGQE